jgi:hypothetical protein
MRFCFAPKALDYSFKTITCAILTKATDELRTVVGLKLCLAKIQVRVSQVFAEQSTKQTDTCGTLFITEAQEHQATSDFSSGELILGQPQSPHLKPVMDNIF